VRDTSLLVWFRAHHERNINKLTTMNAITISDMNAALKVGTIPVQLVRRSNSYCWALPKAITKDGGIDRAAGLSTARLCDFGHASKMKARFNVASRYLAQVFPDSEIAFINPRHVMKLPNWSGSFGGLPELTHAMKRAGLIK
jgi:hypothetical protein